MQKDNSTFTKKAALRRLMLNRLQVEPVIMETHGGAGKLFRAVYSDIRWGVVIEKDERKADLLAQQRPTWSVYQADAVTALAVGAGAHLPVNVLDIDPYGEPWPVIDAFFQSDRPFPDLLSIVVNDGLRQKIKMGGAWSVKSLQPIVERFGNNLYKHYLDVCQLLLNEKAASRGYQLYRFAGYYCGYADQMTHYLAEFKLLPSDKPLINASGKPASG